MAMAPARFWDTVQAEGAAERPGLPSSNLTLLYVLAGCIE
jgi:hypothetical protein